VGLLIRAVMAAAGLWLADLIVPGVHITGVPTLLALGLIFAVVTVVARPVVDAHCFYLYLVTLGILSFAVNAALLMLSAWIAARLGLPLRVDGFRPAFDAAVAMGAANVAIALLGDALFRFRVMTSGS